MPAHHQRAAASLPFIKELNPLASADAVQTPLSDQPAEFWSAFTLVILSGQVPSYVQVRSRPPHRGRAAQHLSRNRCNSRATQAMVDKLCRAKGIQLMVSRACGLYGYLFVNLHKHTFVRYVGARVPRSRSGLVVLHSCVWRPVDALRYACARRAKVAGKKQAPPETITFPTMEESRTAAWAPLLKSRLTKPPPLFFAFQGVNCGV